MACCASLASLRLFWCYLGFAFLVGDQRIDSCGKIISDARYARALKLFEQGVPPWASVGTSGA